MLVNTAAVLLFPTDLGMPSTAVLDILSTYAMVVLKPDAQVLPDVANLQGTPNYTHFLNIALAIKARNSKVKVLLYNYGMAARESQCPDYAIYGDSDVLHRPDGSALMHYAPIAQPGFYPQRVKLLNLGSLATRQKFRLFWMNFCRQNNLDGVLLDAFNPDYYGSWVSTAWSCPNGCLEGFANTSAWWTTALTSLGGELTWEFGLEGRQLWANSIIPTVYDPNSPTHQVLGQDFINSTRYLTGGLNEMSHRSFLGSWQLTRCLVNMGTAIGMSRGYMACYSTDAMQYTENPPEICPLGVGDNTAFKFFLACYLLAHKPGLTYFSFHDSFLYQGVKNNQPYVFDHPLLHAGDIGYPMSGIQWTTGTAPMAYREYEKAIVAVNPKYIGNQTVQSSDYGQLPLSSAYLYRNWDYAAGSLITGPSMNGYPGSGYLLYKV